MEKAQRREKGLNLVRAKGLLFGRDFFFAEITKTKGGDFMNSFKANLMDGQAMMRCLTRMSHEIVEKNKGIEDVVLVGIKRRGEPLAEIIAQNIEKIEGKRPECGVIDINFYRDDLEKALDAPVVKKCELPFSIVDKKVVLVDDVLYTGRTVRAAIEAIFALGRPRASFPRRLYRQSGRHLQKGDHHGKGSAHRRRGGNRSLRKGKRLITYVYNPQGRYRKLTLFGGLNHEANLRNQ